MAEVKKQNISINTGTVVGSTYSQISRVTVSDTDVTIEFEYVHPADPSKGQTVARVTMPKNAGLELARIILSIDTLHNKRKDRKTND